MENISLLLSGECSRGLPCISFISDENWDVTDDFMPPKPWPPTHDVPPPVHEPRSRKERKRKARGSSSHTTPPPSVNWDDDLDDFMPLSITYDVYRFKMYSHLVLLMLYYACMYVCIIPNLHSLDMYIMSSLNRT